LYLLVRGAVDLSQVQSEKNSLLFGKKKHPNNPSPVIYPGGSTLECLNTWPPGHQHLPLHGAQLRELLCLAPHYFSPGQTWTALFWVGEGEESVDVVS